MKNKQINTKTALAIILSLIAVFFLDIIYGEGEVSMYLFSIPIGLIVLWVTWQMITAPFKLIGYYVSKPINDKIEKQNRMSRIKSAEQNALHKEEIENLRLQNELLKHQIEMLKSKE